MANERLVHIIDDDEAMRESLSFLLSTAGIESRTYATADAFLDDLDGTVSGCVVTDVRMPGSSGLELLSTLRSRGHALPVIVITGHGDVPLAVEAMKLGAVDFLEKPFDDEVMVEAIRSAWARQEKDGEADERRVAIRERMGTLSERERQVLEGLVAGQPNKAIAYDLGISPRTVEVYRANVMTKMRANSLSDLVRMALIVSG